MGSGSEPILILVVVTAVGFDFTNGFHDTANTVATSTSRCPRARATRSSAGSPAPRWWPAPGRGGRVMLLGAIVDGSALWKIVVASAVDGIGLVIAFAMIRFGLQKAERHRADPLARAAGLTLATVSAVSCLAVVGVGVGVWAMAQKPSTSKPAAKAQKAS